MNKYQSIFVFKIFLVFNILSVKLSNAQVTWLEVYKYDDKIDLHDHQTTISYNAEFGSKLINYNATIRLDHPINIPSVDLPFGQCQVFTIFQSEEKNKEGLIWTLNAGSENQMLFTDKRVADLNKGKFINFLDSKTSNPQLCVYQHTNNRLKMSNLLIGGLPKNKNIPVSIFEGELAEVIIFDRILNPQSRQLLESTLALKYGLKLDDNVNYFSNHGDILWDRTKDEPFNTNISGIGKVANLHFNQKQSKSSFGSGNINIGLNGLYSSNMDNPSKLSDGQYFVWADNGKEIEFSKTNGMPLTLQRKWKYKSINFKEKGQFSFQLEHSRLAKELTDKMNYWIACKRGSNIEATHNFTTFYKLEKQDNYFSCNNIPLTNDGYFTILKAPNFWAYSIISHPECQNEQMGRLRVKPVGGIPPYQISITSEGGEIEHYTFEDSIWISPEITAGNHRLSILDSNGDQWDDIILLNYSDIESIHFKESYILNEKSKVVLDASKNMNGTYDYKWICPGGKVINSPVLEASKAGKYKLEVSKGECINNHEILINDSNKLIENLTLSPNPSADGNYNLTGVLTNANSFQILIHNSQGVLIKSTEFDAAKYIHYLDHIQDAGVYYVTLKTGQSQQTLKLIVINSH